MTTIMMMKMMKRMTMMITKISKVKGERNGAAKSQPRFS